MLAIALSIFMTPFHSISVRVTSSFCGSIEANETFNYYSLSIVI